jgi:hypothetical protein
VINRSQRETEGPGLLAKDYLILTAVAEAVNRAKMAVTRMDGNAVCDAGIILADE